MGDNQDDSINDVEQDNNEELAPEKFRKMFIGGISYSTTKEKLEEYFGKYGEIVDSVVMIDSRTERSRGFGFITFKYPSCVDDVQHQRPHKIDGRVVEPRRAVPREDANKPESSTKLKICKVFIGGLHSEVEENHLKEYFESYGNITSAKLVTEKDTNKKRGFGFVEFDDYDPVDKITLRNDHEILQKRVEVKRALSRQQIDENKSANRRQGGSSGGGRFSSNSSSSGGGGGGYRGTGSYNQGGGGGGWSSGGGGGGYMSGGGGYDNGYNSNGNYDMGSGYNNSYGGGPMRGGGGGGYSSRGAAPYGGGGGGGGGGRTEHFLLNQPETRLAALGLPIQSLFLEKNNSGMLDINVRSDLGGLTSYTMDSIFSPKQPASGSKEESTNIHRPLLAVGFMGLGCIIFSTLIPLKLERAIFSLWYANLPIATITLA
ncbi:Heterogeneous nuclear ribonucleoprotein A1, A2/B1 [Nymphon striatum]|nr:Heterogeneous nuclear ribonucleoprotein A1, A2/B1 [Nymphon striatum]